MKDYRNHEGYIDRIAGEAIQRVDRQIKHSKKVKSKILTYQIGEVPAFRETVRGLMR